MTRNDRNFIYKWINDDSHRDAACVNKLAFDLGMAALELKLILCNKKMSISQDLMEIIGRTIVNDVIDVGAYVCGDYKTFDGVLRDNNISF